MPPPRLQKRLTALKTLGRILAQLEAGALPLDELVDVVKQIDRLLDTNVTGKPPSAYSIAKLLLIVSGDADEAAAAPPAQRLISILMGRDPDNNPLPANQLEEPQAILALALEMYTDWPLSICYLIASLGVVPLVMHGITLISRLHARIEMVRGRFLLVDQSTNGTFVLNADGKESFVRRDSVTLQGEGCIGLGKLPDPNAAGVIRFALED